MSYSELSEWAEYLQLFPLHEDRSEFQMAVLSNINIANVSKKSHSVDDFMITNKKPKAELQGKALEDYIFKMMG